ncbi:SPOR domain-containing protein [Devosia sp. LC5]|uniref:SPOR domain-containing protein n=1 Tax=Devosia sp. LC5 TaxID=1502724 RepID=UPI0012687B77|nr:SPOR domain-containing protein [Devosia sp. LC5]
MAGQSDADDLIAELAKLMAQDARTDSPAPSAPQPASPQPTPFPVRIPGGESPAAASPTPVPRFDFNRPAETPAAPQPAAQQAVPPRREPEPAPVAPVVTAKPVVAPTPVAPAPAEARREPDAFNFDLDFAPKSSPVSSPVPQAPQPAGAAPASAPSPSPDTAPSAPASGDYDSIADLIAAELLGDTQPEPPPAAAPLVAAPAQQAARPVVSGGLVVDQDEGAGHRQPSPEPAPKLQADSFKIPPVFGLGTRPGTPAVSTSAPEAPTPSERRAEAPASATSTVTESAAGTLGSDPIDEIENLIGRAVRVDMDSSAPAKPTGDRPVASPALRSLATPTLVQPAAKPPRPVSEVDETILAAAAATGADIGWVETPDAEEAKPGKRRIGAERAPRAPRSFNFSRALAGPVVAIVLLAAAGFGLYWVLGMGGESGPPPVLTADATPIKETPAAQPATGAAQQSVVFNEIDGVQPGSDEQLVSRDQADVNEVTQVASTPSVSEEGLANRKVRTVTVRPDGTIVSGEETVAGSAILPVDRPNVPEVPGAETASPELLAAAAEAEPAPTPAATPVVPPVTPVTPGSTVPAVDAAGNPIAGKTTIVPRTRPASFAQQTASAAPATTVDAIINDAAVAPAPTPAPTPAPAASTAAIPPGATEVDALPNDAPAYVQLASQRSEAEARQTAQAMVTRFGPLFGGANMEVQRVDLGARGIFYRVRVPANSLQAANDMCTQVKAAGGDCFTM